MRKSNRITRAAKLASIDQEKLNERIVRNISKIPSYKHPIIPWAKKGTK